MKTKVLFLFEKDSKNEVFAYFPDIIENADGARLCYAHVGQHSGCMPHYVKFRKEADFDAYNDLKKELESIGYKVQVLNADYERQNAISKGKVWQVRYTKDSFPFKEGTKTECFKYLRDNKLMREYKKGTIRIGKVIYEPSLPTV